MKKYIDEQLTDESVNAQIKGLRNMLLQHEAGEIKLTNLELYNIKMFVSLSQMSLSQIKNIVNER